MSFVKKYWISICSVLAIGISGFFLYKIFLRCHSCPPEGIGETVGKSLIYALLGFFVATSLRKRWKRKKLEFGILFFAVSFSLCAIYDVIKINGYFCRLNNSKQELVRLMRDTSNSSQSKSSNNYTTEQYGDFAELLLIIKQTFESSEKMASEINIALEDCQDILTPTYLSEYENIIQAKDRIANLVEILNQCEKKYHEELASMESKIHKAFLGNEDLKKGVLKGFEEGKQTSSKLHDEYIQIEKKSAQRINDILNFLSARSGTFYEADGAFFFKGDEDVIQYNDLVQKLVEQFKEEEIIIQKLEAHQQSTLQRMENFDLKFSR